MERSELLKKIHSLKNDEMIDLKNGFSVKRTHDKVWFMCNNKVYNELNMLSQQSIYYERFRRNETI